MARATVLIVEDEAAVRQSLQQRLAREGYEIIEARSARETLEQLPGLDLVLLSEELTDADGFSVLRQIKECDSDVLVIMLTASGTRAVEAMRLGAYHHTSTPLNVDEVAIVVETALETRNLRRIVEALRVSEAHTYRLDSVVGNSPQMRAVKDLIARVAASPAATALLMGETGVGKKLAARVLHYSSDRAERPFVSVTCSALPDQPLESQLFGHERGEWSGVRQQKHGLIETADGGTLFLDEIGDLTPALQVRLLRLLEEKAFRRVGAIVDIRVDVRVIAATSRNLEQLVSEGKFREDLYYRLQMMPIVFPPLRERRGDVPLLANHFIDRFNREFRRKVRGVSADAIKELEGYSWPGNVLEMRNALERAVLLATGDWLPPQDFYGVTRGGGSEQLFQLPSHGVNLEEVERELLVQALERVGGNQTHAGQLLGINRDQVRYRIEKFGLQLPTHEKVRDS